MRALVICKNDTVLAAVSRRVVDYMLLMQDLAVGAREAASDVAQLHASVKAVSAHMRKLKAAEE